jgi:hypothetical protein
VFGLFFAVIYAGSKFKTQPGESVVKSFFLTFYKDKPGRFIITTRRLVFVPEAFSHWFGATRLMIELDQVDKIESQSTLAGGKLSLSTLNGSVYHFSMPNLVLEPLTQKLKEIAAQHSNHEVHSVSLDNALTPTPSDTDPFIEEIITAEADSNVVGDGTNMNSTIEVTMSPNMVPDTKFSDPNIATDQASLIITVVPPKAGADGEAKSTSR